MSIINCTCGQSCSGTDYECKQWYMEHLPCSRALRERTAPFRLPPHQFADEPTPLDALVRRRKWKSTRTSTVADSDGDILIYCWCGARPVYVRADLVGESTSSCGRPGCMPSRFV